MNPTIKVYNIKFNIKLYEIYENYYISIKNIVRITLIFFNLNFLKEHT